jgi:hypothetical protein
MELRDHAPAIPQVDLQAAFERARMPGLQELRDAFGTAKAKVLAVNNP